MQNEEIFDYAVWVDRTDYLPLEDSSSMSIEQWMCNYTIDNNGDLARLRKNVDVLIRTIFKNQGLSLPVSNGYLPSATDVDSSHILSSDC
jgi:hypothetical protein